MPKIKPQQTVHIKSKNKTGMVIAVNGNKLTVMTINGNITADVNDVEIVKAHEGKESMKLKDIAQPKKKINEGLFNPGYLDKLYSPLFDAHTEIGMNLEQNGKLERYRAEFNKIEIYLDNAQKLMDKLSKY